MLLYYAMGGGLGHLTRTCRVIHSLAIDRPVLVVSASTFMETLIFPDNVVKCVVPVELSSDPCEFQRFLAKYITSHNITEVYVDCFPAGIIGELIDFNELNELPLTLIARNLKSIYLQQYGQSLQIFFERVIAVEALSNEYETFLKSRTHQFKYEILLLEQSFDISYCNNDDDKVIYSNKELLSKAWLVVHSGPEDEVKELLGYAKQMQEVEKVSAPLVLVSFYAPQMAIKYHHINTMNATALYPLVQRIITACGFNSMQETRNYRQKHSYLPFPRRYDDQYFRAQHARLD